LKAPGEVISCDPFRKGGQRRLDPEIVVGRIRWLAGHVEELLEGDVEDLT
jgi:hypothetical protein